MSRLQLGVFASGRGSNFTAIIENIQKGTLNADIKLLLTNNKNAGAIKIALVNKIPFMIIDRSMFDDRKKFVEKIIDVLKEHKVSFIALAGYMKKIPAEVVSLYKNKITNIHPALLPSFGGRGMYGQYVHQHVLERGCKVTGVTVHLVDNKYDHGPIVAQQCVEVKQGDTIETLAKRVLKVEHKIYSETLQLFANNKVTVRDNIVQIK